MHLLLAQAFGIALKFSLILLTLNEYNMYVMYLGHYFEYEARFLSLLASLEALQNQGVHANAIKFIFGFGVWCSKYLSFASDSCGTGEIMLKHGSIHCNF